MPLGVDVRCARAATCLSPDVQLLAARLPQGPSRSPASLLVVKGAGCDEAKLATQPAFDPPCNVVRDTGLDIAVAAHGSQNRSWSSFLIICLLGSQNKDLIENKSIHVVISNN